VEVGNPVIDTQVQLFIHEHGYDIGGGNHHWPVLQLKHEVLKHAVCRYREIYCTCSAQGKGKAIPLQAWTGSEGSRRLRFPDFKTVGT
jgi:hypothetical protein